MMTGGSRERKLRKRAGSEVSEENAKLLIIFTYMLLQFSVPFLYTLFTIWLINNVQVNTAGL